MSTTGMLPASRSLWPTGLPVHRSTLSELIARGVWSPPDDRHGTGDRRRVPALLAIEPGPGVARCRSSRVVVARGDFMDGSGRPTSARGSAARYCG